LLNDIDQLNDADDAAGREIVGHFHAKMLFDLLDRPFVPSHARVNRQRAAIVRGPCPIFYALDPFKDQMRVGLADREGFHFSPSSMLSIDNRCLIINRSNKATAWGIGASPAIHRRHVRSSTPNIRAAPICVRSRRAIASRYSDAVTLLVPLFGVDWLVALIPFVNVGPIARHFLTMAFAACVGQENPVPVTLHLGELAGTAGTRL
jgi:hypothetical protein